MEVEESEPGPSQSDRDLVSMLRCPKPSELARKRKLKRNAANAPSTKYRRHLPKTINDPKSVTPFQRVAEYPKEPFTVSAGKLFCRACREEVGLKKSVIDNHIQRSKKHSTGKEVLSQKQEREQDIATALREFNSTEHIAGEHLPEEQQVFRVKVVSTFLKAGVPMNKIDCFRNLLEETGLRLAGRRSMSDVIPFIHQAELKEEVKGRKVSIVFDGTTHLGEAMAIVLRFVDDEWGLQQRLVRLQLLSKSMSGEVARQLISVLQMECGITSTSLVAAMHDRASVNRVAMTVVRVIYISRCSRHWLLQSYNRQCW